MSEPRDRLARAATFVQGHARLIERRLFEMEFEGGSPQAAVEAILAYQNPDGGFGHAVEPDLRVSTSQPIFAFYALTALRATGEDVVEAVARTCDWLAGVAHEDGSLAYALPDALEHARAGHWNGDYALAPSLNATAGIAGALCGLGVQHVMLDRAAAWCVEQVEGSPAYTAHTMLNTLDLLHGLGRSDLWERVSGRLFEADYVLMDPAATTYGLSPLRFAPTPDAPLRPLFDDAVIDAHLDAVAAQQEHDGGWPISWTPPPGAATNEWRGRWTLEAVGFLRAYGRLS